MKKIMLPFVIVFVLLGCGGVPQIDSQVCLVGKMICDVGNGLCSTGTIPPPVCSYLNIACFNLTLLCAEPPGSEAYIKAENKLKDATVGMKRWLEKMKKDKSLDLDSSDN